ncbi:MAG TPA: hypothetical protein VNL91_08000 [Thermoanaerobaculia bacterium]|nr:hypothetical protein [Thermoanaerobaculia bacterium]
MSFPPRLASFVRPLYIDLDGVSRFEEVERIATIARDLYVPRDGEESRAFEILLIFHRLGGWLEKVGNISRTLLACGGEVTEEELRRTARSIRRLSTPSSEIERAVASAVRIDEAGLRGLAERFARARREGLSIDEVARAALAGTEVPEWFTDEARKMLRQRLEARRAFCLALLEESAPRGPSAK